MTDSHDCGLTRLRIYRVSNSTATVLSFYRIHHHQAATTKKNCHANKNQNKEEEKQNKWNVLLCLAKVNAGMSQRERKNTRKTAKCVRFVYIWFRSHLNVSPYVIKSSVHSLASATEQKDGDRLHFARTR